MAQALKDIVQVRDDAFCLPLACQLFEHGFFTEAEDFLVSIEERDAVGPALLKVCYARQIFLSTN